MLGSSLRYLLPGEIAMYVSMVGLILNQSSATLLRIKNHAKHLFADVADSTGGDARAGRRRERLSLPSRASKALSLLCR